MLLPDPRDQEYLLHAIERAHGIASLHELYLWSQGALQALLPHRILLCAQLDEAGRVRLIECLHGTLLTPEAKADLCNPSGGPVPQWLHAWRQGGALPLPLTAGEYGAALVHGSGALAGGASAFILLGMPEAAGLRASWLLQLLLPYLHLSLQRIAGARAPAPAAPISPRQMEILVWLREGKSNEEIGHLLGISALTVKNHLQRLYRQLGVSNRAHAVARSAASLHG